MNPNTFVLQTKMEGMGSSMMMLQTTLRDSICMRKTKMVENADQ